MALVNELKDELEFMTEYVQLQVASGNSLDFVLESQFESTKASLSNIGKLTNKQAGPLIDAVTKGPWMPEQRKVIAAMIDAKTKKGADHSHRKLQTCLHFEQCLTEPEWLSLRSNALIAAKIGQLAQRAFSIGLTCPTEPTTFRMAAILAETDNSGTSMTRLSLPLKRLIRKRSTHTGTSCSTPHRLLTIARTPTQSSLRKCSSSPSQKIPRP